MDEEKPLNLLRAKGSKALREALAMKQDPDQKRGRGRPKKDVDTKTNTETALPRNEDKKEYRRAWEGQEQPTITPTPQFKTTFSPKQMCAAVLESHKIGYDQGVKETLEKIGIIIGIHADDVIEALKHDHNIGGQSA